MTSWLGLAASLALAAPSVNVSLDVGDPILSVGQRTSISVLAEVLNPASSTDGLFSFDLNVTFSAPGILAIDGSTIVQPDAEILLSPGTVGPTGLSVSYGTYFYHQSFGVGSPKELIRFSVDALAPGSLNLTVSADTMIGDDFMLHQSATPAVTYPAARSVSVAPRADRTWGVNAGGNFSTDSKWVTGVAPNAPGDVAIFGTAIDHNCTVAVDTPTTLGTLKFDDNNNYLLAGPSAVTLQASGTGHAALTVDSAHGNGAHTIAAGLVVASDLDITQDSFGALTIAGPLDNRAGRTITKNGDGSVTFQGPLTFGTGSLLLVYDGTVNLDSDAGSVVAANLSIDVMDATVNFGHDQHLDWLTIGSGGKVAFTGAHVVVLNHLVIGGLDLGATALTPEPATLSLLALGGLALLRRRRTASS